MKYKERKWSKGPWYSDDLYVGSYHNHTVYSGTETEEGDRVDEHESFWNACLISAAPDMFEAIMAMLPKYKEAFGEDDAYKEALHSLNKATRYEIP